MKRSTNIALACVALAATLLGLWLVFSPGSDESETSALGFEDSSIDEVARRAGFDFPGSTEEFLTAQPDGQAQMDITFTAEESEVDEFLVDSNLPPKKAGERVILHSSPLWELNPDSEISSSVGSHGGIGRTVEITDEDDRSRIRIVLVEQ